MRSIAVFHGLIIRHTSDGFVGFRALSKKPWFVGQGVPVVPGKKFLIRLHDGGKYDNIYIMRNTRPVSWLKAARRDFEEFPEDVQSDMLDALTIAAEGGKSDKAKPFKGVEGGVFEIALRYRGDAFRTLYAVTIGAEIWVIHAFQKKSKSGIKTPQAEVDLIRERLKRLKEAMQ
ncbi:MAG: type II toxin-antitoxin system RelE/ParE family toxin [Methylococcales bacterium]